MKNYIGIDFGACNIKAAKVSGTGKSLKIKLNKQQHSGNFVPNAILYDDIKGNLEIKVGASVANSGDFENTVRQIKPKIAQKDWKKFIPNLKRDVTAVEVARDIFKWIWREITVKSAKEETLEAAITVPVSFSEVQKQLIRQAALDAGIPVEAVVTESFAGLFSLEKILENDEEQVVLIFDFGGSTLDVSIFRIERDDILRITELAAAGLKFGGNDIDSLIFENILSVKCADEINEILEGDALGSSRTKIFIAIANMKEDIFSNDEDDSTGFVDDKNGDIHEFTVTRAEITDAIEKSGVKAKIIKLIDGLLEDAEVDREEVTTVKAFGGTSTIDYFRDILTDYFGDEVFDGEDFEADDVYMSVALGAARYIADGDDSSVEIRNVVPYSIGLAEGGSFVMYIKRNAPGGFVTPFSPIKISELDKNNWSIAVYQSFSGEFEMPLDSEDVIFIGNVELDRKLYTAEDAVLFKMKTDGAGQILMRFFERRQDLDEPLLIEEMTVRVGG